MKERNTLPVARVKGLLLVTVFQQLKPAVSEHTVAVHQQQLDASRPAPGLFKFRVCFHVD
jgi:hypothetical protein